MYDVIKVVWCHLGMMVICRKGWLLCVAKLHRCHMECTFRMMEKILHTLGVVGGTCQEIRGELQTNLWTRS